MCFFWPLYWVHIEMFTFMLMTLMMMTTTMMMCCFWPLWWVHTLELCDPWQHKPNARVTVAKLKLIKQNKTFQRQKLRLKNILKTNTKRTRNLQLGRRSGWHSCLTVNMIRVRRDQWRKIVLQRIQKTYLEHRCKQEQTKEIQKHLVCIPCHRFLL